MAISEFSLYLPLKGKESVGLICFKVKDIVKSAVLLISMLFSMLIHSGYAVAATPDSLRKLAAKAGHDTTAIKLYAKIGDYFDENNKYDSALSYYNKALSKVSGSNEKLFAPALYTKLSRLFSSNGNYALSLEYLFKALAIYDNIASQPHDTAGLDMKTARVYSDIGMSYFSTENFPKALEYFEKGLHLVTKYQNIKDDPEILKTLFIFNLNMGSVNVAIRNFSEARRYFEIALRLNQSIGNPVYDGVLYNNMGIILKEENNLNKAHESYLKAVVIRESLKDTAGIAQVLNNLGNLEYTQGNYKKAIEYLQRALDYSKKSKSLKSEKLSADFLSRSYEKAGNYAKALEMFKQFMSLHDSIINNEQLNQTARLELQYLHEKQRKETELQQQIELAKKERKSLIYMIIAGISLFSIIILYLINRNQAIKIKQVKLVKEGLELEQKNLNLEKQNLLLEKQNLEMELEYRNKELATHVMYLLNKNEFLTSITEKLLSIRHMLLPENRTVIQEIIRDLKSNIDNTVWNEFEVRFQNVHEDFYQKLSERYPDLTPNETKLCAFLRLNMTTKDISSITFQSPKSIQVARARLRKKLGITRDENLIKVLQEL